MVHLLTVVPLESLKISDSRQRNYVGRALSVSQLWLTAPNFLLNSRNYHFTMFSTLSKRVLENKDSLRTESVTQHASSSGVGGHPRWTKETCSECNTLSMNLGYVLCNYHQGGHSLSIPARQTRVGHIDLAAGCVHLKSFRATCELRTCVWRLSSNFAIISFALTSKCEQPSLKLQNSEGQFDKYNYSIITDSDTTKFATVIHHVVGLRPAEFHHKLLFVSQTLDDRRRKDDKIKDWKGFSSLNPLNRTLVSVNA